MVRINCVDIKKQTEINIRWVLKKTHFHQFKIVEIQFSLLTKAEIINLHQTNKLLLCASLCYGDKQMFTPVVIKITQANN